jgi:peptidyl-tRNA hydrolase, PTH1 family
VETAARWLVVGLGNPGQMYARTRHNVGFLVLDRLAEARGARFSQATDQAVRASVALGGVPVLLLKPQTFMNLSGLAVGAWRERLALPAERMLLVHDDLDLPLGRLRVVCRAGAGGHRGVASIHEILGATDCPRVRVGIGRPAGMEAAAARVLGEFTPVEDDVVSAVLGRAAAAVVDVVCDGPMAAMNRHNGWSGSPAGIRSEGPETVSVGE